MLNKWPIYRVASIIIGMFITLVTLFLLICSFSVFYIVIFDIDFSESLPISIGSISLLLFIIGFFRKLSISMYIVIAVGVLCLIIGIAKSIFDRKTKKTLSNLINGYFFGFLFLYLILIYCNYQRLAYSWDEFSHWADVVKAMLQIEDFITNNASNSLFQSYPPIMSLFQYFVEKINIVFGDGIYTEWYLYLSYELFYFSFVFPIIKKIKNILLKTVYIISIFVVPAVFNMETYSAIYIDSFLSMVAGNVMTYILLENNTNNRFLHIYTYLSLSILVISKDLGLVLGVFLLLAYIIKILYLQSNLKSKLINIVLGFISLIAPKLMWSYRINVDNAHIRFSNPIDFSELVSIVLHKNDTYRQIVYNNYFLALSNSRITIPIINIHITYYMIFIFILVSLIFIYLINKDRKYNKTISIIYIVEVIAYILGMVIIYVFKFDKNEALAFASLDRYLSIIINSMMIVIIGNICNELIKYKKVAYYISFMIVMADVLLFVSTQQYKLFTREYVKDSIEVRSKYFEIENQVKSYCEDNSKIYFVSQNDDGFDFYVSRYLVRPSLLPDNNNEYTWIVNYSEDEWMYKLINDNYNYVLIYKIDNDFISRYSNIFKEVIEEDSLYKVDRESRLLVKCK